MKTLVFRDDPGQCVKVGIGQFFRHVESDFIYILAESGENHVALICLGDGEAWHDPIPVEDMRFLSKQEWHRATFGHVFEAVSAYVKEN